MSTLDWCSIAHCITLLLVGNPYFTHSVWLLAIPFNVKFIYMVAFASRLPFEVVACNIFYAGHLPCVFPVRADKALVKDVLTCTPLTPSTYKFRHPDDLDAVGGSSEDEAEGLGENPGVSHRLQKPPRPEPTLEPTPTPTPVLLKRRV